MFLLITCLAALAAGTDGSVALPCDPRTPYEAPRDPRLADLFDEKALEPAACTRGSSWLAPYEVGDDFSGPGGAFRDEHRTSLFWGTFRPHIYFGMKTRTYPAAAVTGVMWRRQRSPRKKELLLRHECKETDQLSRYGWQAHDGRLYGRQEIVDRKLWVTLKTGFAKLQLLEQAAGGSPTGPAVEWAQRVEVVPIGSSGNAEAERAHGPVELFFYIGADCDSLHLRGSQCLDAGGVQGVQNVAVRDTDDVDSLGRLITVAATVSVPSPRPLFAPSGEAPPSGTQQTFLLTTRADKVEWRCVDDVASVDAATESFEEAGDGSCALVVFKITAAHTSVAFDAVLLGRGSPEPNPKALDRLVDKALARGEALFEEKFAAAYGSSETKADEAVAARHAISNLLAGAGFWYGALKVHDSSGPVETAPYPLFSFTPSRAYFPRGFLWDEGFHLKAAARFDVALAAESFASWMMTMRGHENHAVCKGGWIPREQAIGRAAQQHVPNEFLAQNPSIANPPTLLSIASSELLLEKRGGEQASSCGSSPLAAGCSSSLYDVSDLRGSMLPYLEAWTRWLIDSQEANPAAYFKTGLEPVDEYPKTGLYAWKGRDHNDRRLVPMTLSSGFDDYPRSYWPSQHEAHLDLACWVVSSFNALADIAEAKEGRETPYVAEYRHKAHAALSAISVYHYDSEKGSYADRGLVSQRTVRKGTVSDGTPIGTSVTLRRDVCIRCANDADDDTMDSGIPIDEMVAMQQYERWQADQTIREKMRVKITKTLRFKKSDTVIWQGTKATVLRAPGRKQGMIEVQSDTSVTFNVRLEEVFPLISTAKPHDFCPPSHPNFKFPLGDGKGGLQSTAKIVSVEAPRPGLLTEHIGYVSFMPLLLKLLPYTEGTRDHVDELIIAMEDDDFFSNYGLRSLASSSPIYMLENAPGDAPYWRGAVWINMNYLAATALQHYENQGSQEAARVRMLLQRRIYRTVVQSYNKTGYFFEHYDDLNGLGQRSHPFTGWTALVTNLITDSPR